jgi:undecaprenyl-diphosphatase
LEPLPGQDRRSARYLVSSRSRPDLFVKVVSRERRDSDLLYRAWRWLKPRGRPQGRLGDAVAQVEHEASMALLAAAAGVRTPPVLLVRSFGNGAGLLVQERVAGRDLTNPKAAERLDEARLADIWRQVAGLRAARIAHRDLGLDSIMLDDHAKAWLVDFDRAEAAASDRLLDRDLATLLAALGRVADPAQVRATAEQALGEEAPQRREPPLCLAFPMHSGSMRQCRSAPPSNVSATTPNARARSVANASSKAYSSASTSKALDKIARITTTVEAALFAGLSQPCRVREEVPRARAVGILVAA